MWYSILGFGLLFFFGIYDTSAERVMLSGPIHAFSNDIFARLGQKETGNMVFSPYSIHTIMAMALNGSPENSKTYQVWNSASLLNCSIWCCYWAMLLKLSKCEVKAWLCWSLIIIQPIRFCVKSHFGKFKRSNNVIYGNFRDAELWILVDLGLESCSDLLKIKIQNL